MIFGFNVWTLWRPVYSFTWGLWQKSSYEHFADFTRKNHDLTILDIGTGVGPYIKYLGEKNKNRFIFSEPDRLALKVAERRVKKYLPNMMKKNAPEFLIGYAEDILKKTKKVDIIVLVHVISVLPHPDAFLKLALQHLKPGGKIMLYVNTRKSKLAHSLNPLTRALGFQSVDMEKIIPKKYRVERAGALNTCYIIEK